MLSLASVPQVAGGGVQPALALGRGREFLEEVFDAGRQLGQSPGPGTVRELEVGPEVLEHLDEMRLAGAEEPAHPDARLLGLVQVAEVGAEDAAQPFGVLAVADEVGEFVAQGLEFGGRLPAGDLGDALVEQRVGTRVLLVDLAVHHRRANLPFAGRDRDRQVVPAVSRVEQAVVVLLVDAGEEDQQPAPDVALDQRQDFGDLEEAEQGRHPVQGHHRVVGIGERGQRRPDPRHDRLLEVGEHGVIEQFRRLEVALGVAGVVRAAQPVGEGVGQVDGRPWWPAWMRRLLEQPQPEPQLPLVFLVVDGEPDPLRAGDVAVPRVFAESLVVLLEEVNPAHGTPSPPGASAGRGR